jgi:uncharacterized protein (DUF342 family)
MAQNPTVPGKPDPLASQMRLSIQNEDMDAVLKITGRFDPTVNYETIIKLLDEYRVRVGVNTQKIKEIIKNYRANKDGIANVSEIVAKGIPVKPGLEGQVIIMIEKPEPVKIDEEGRADYRNIQRFKTVKKGDLLARRIPAKPGENGLNVFREVIPAPEVENPTLDSGQNVIMNPETFEYFATANGIFIHENDIIQVNPILEIRGNVGLETGNIQYEGSIKITGNIERGSKVSCLKDLVIGGTIESGDISVKGSLNVREGIKTQKSGFMFVGADLTAAHVENSELTIDGNVTIKNAIIASKIVTCGQVNVTNSGSVIVGGEITAYSSVIVENLGNKSETNTKIIMGEHYKHMENYNIQVKELENIEKEFINSTEEIQRLKEYIQRMKGKILPSKVEEIKKKFTAYKQLVEKRKVLLARHEQTKKNRYNPKEVKLIVKDTLYPGVQIFYKNHIERILKPQTRCQIRFKPHMERIAIEAYI